MSLRSFKCTVELTIHEVTAPGTRLANKDDLYLNVCLLGQQRRTRLAPSIFPLKFSDNLIFEKTFKFCRNEDDVLNFLNDLHVLIELIQLGRVEKNQVLAFYETNVKEFLYPEFECQQRNAFMTKNETFPGQISPQIIFCTRTRIDETQTPSLDILREYENRFANDPLLDLSKKKIKKKSKKRSKQSIINTHFDNFANHTISSAIKADYSLPDVKLKLEELNKSVQKTKIVKTAPTVKVSRIYTQNSTTPPFVVRKVKDELILRKPELHDVLHDGLILINKSPMRTYKKSTKTKRKSRSLLSKSSENLSLYHHKPERLNRSLSARSLTPSLNRNLRAENYRSRSGSAGSSRFGHNRTYDIVPDFEDQYDHEHLSSNCEVCKDFGFRNEIKKRAMNTNTSAIFNNINLPRSASKSKKDILNETRLLNSDELIHSSKMRNLDYPRNKSFSHYAPSRLDWKYSRYYPWLFNYTEYLRDLEEDLYWLKVRSKYLSIY